MQKVIVDVVSLQLLQRVLIHRYAGLVALRVRVEVRQFRGDEYLFAVVLLEGDARTGL